MLMVCSGSSNVTLPRSSLRVVGVLLWDSGHAVQVDRGRGRVAEATYRFARQCAGAG